ncbi:MAG: rod shape-determining protein MreC [Patescibacteria group bacterium]
MRRLGFFLGVLLLLGVIGLGMQYIPIFGVFNDGVARVTVPAARTLSLWSQHFRSAFTVIVKSRTMAAEFESLRTRAGILSAQVADLQMLSTENASLRKQLNFLEETKLKFTAAAIIGLTNDDGRSILILDRGARHGVGVGMPLVAEGGILIGKIIKVEEQKSFALVTMANHSRTAVSLAKTPGTNGLITGDRNLSLTLDYVPADVPLSVGDIVVTSGLEPLVPRGLVVGTVDELLPAENSLFQRAYIAVPYSLSELQYASVILSNAQ